MLQNKFFCLSVFVGVRRYEIVDIFLGIFLSSTHPTAVLPGIAGNE
ncbi:MULTISPECIES: hypothetical protein [unclassified Microcoleus]|nr:MULTISPECIES: hypothetical protein [unclassified Microcoleus]